MPNVPVSIYINDDEFAIYVKDKTKYLEAARVGFRALLPKRKDKK